MFKIKFDIWKCIDPLIQLTRPSSSLLSGTVKASSFSCPPILSQKRRCSYFHSSEKRVEVKSKRWPHSLHLPHLWLRDHCRCPLCYNVNTNQRMLDITAVSPDIKPCNLSLHEDVLKITWPDEHHSEYPLKFLWQNSFDGQVTSHKDTRNTWNCLNFPPLGRISVTQNALFNTNDGLKSVMNSLNKFGIAMVTEVPANVKSTRAVVEAIGPVMRTFYGEMWAFSDVMEHSDTAYTNTPLGAHTDTIYFNEGARLQVFHCLQAAPEGGETLIVDGFMVLKKLQEKYPDAYKFFSNHTLCGEFVGDGHHFLSLHKVINHHPVTQQLLQFRYNLYDRAPIKTLTLQQLEQYYTHLRSLASLVTHSNSEVWLKLAPGTVLFIDNWRVMHGRAGYSGARKMAGCYVANDDFCSKARTLNIIS